MHEILDEMPETWVRQVVNAIEAHGHDVADAHDFARLDYWHRRGGRQRALEGDWIAR